MHGMENVKLIYFSCDTDAVCLLRDKNWIFKYTLG
jgi:hypothetical protein